MTTLALLQNDSRDLWEENRDLVRRLSRVEAQLQRRLVLDRWFVDAVNDGLLEDRPLKETAAFRLLEDGVERWEAWNAKHAFLGEEGA